MRRRQPTDEQLAQGFNPADDGTTNADCPDHLLHAIRAAYDEARRIEARRYAMDLIAERRCGT